MPLRRGLPDSGWQSLTVSVCVEKVAQVAGPFQSKRLGLADELVALEVETAETRPVMLVKNRFEDLVLASALGFHGLSSR
jgi:hypothetical protein